MSSDPNSMSGLGVRFSAAESDDQDYARAHNSSEESEHPTKVGAFANFFEEFEQESDGMSQYSQPNRNWQQAMLHSFDHENVHEITDSSDVFNQHNFPSPYMHDVDPDLVYMDRYGELSQPVNPFTSYGEFPNAQPATLPVSCGDPNNAVGAANSSSLPFSLSLDRRGNRQMYSKPPKVLAGRYLLGGTIGRGSYGKVKDCIDLVTLRRCAVKIVSKLGVRKIPGGWSQALTEACILRSLAPHRHIVAVATVLRLTAPDRVALVMEHCLGSVHDLQAAGVHASFPVSPPTGADGDDDAADTPTGAVNAPHPHLHSTTEAFHRTSTLPTMDDVEAPMHSYGKPPAVAGLRKQSAFDWSQAHHPKADQSEAGTLGFQQFRRLPEAQAHAYFIQVIDGLGYLHANGIIHRDIKPANLLITPAPGSGLDPSAMLSHEYTDCVGTYHPGLVPFSPEEVLRLSRGYLIKLADFGVSVSIPTFTPSVQVGAGQITPAVQPPEVAKGAQNSFHGPKLDVYSAGVSLFFMLTGRVPFSSPNVLQIFEAITEGFYVIPGHVSAPAAHLIRGMMCKNPEKRLSLESVARHEWICNPTHHPPPSLSTAAHACASHWQSVASISTPTPTQAPRGFPCWLDPLFYLQRPTPQFQGPHIDDTGARIFSLLEIDTMYASGQIQRPPAPSPPPQPQPSPTKFSITSFEDREEEEDEEEEDGEVETSSFPHTDGYLTERHIAPPSVIKQLRAFHNWPPLPTSEDNDLDETRAFFHEATDLEAPLDESLAQLGIMDYGETNMVPLPVFSPPMGHTASDYDEPVSLQPFDRPLGMCSTVCRPPTTIIATPPTGPSRVHWPSQPNASETSTTPRSKKHARRRHATSDGAHENHPLSPEDIPVEESHRFTIVAGARGCWGESESGSGSLTRRHLLGPLTSEQLSRLAWHVEHQQQRRLQQKSGTSDSSRPPDDKTTRKVREGNQKVEKAPRGASNDRPPQRKSRRNAGASRLTRWFSDSLSLLRQRIRTWTGSGTGALERSFSQASPSETTTTTSFRQQHHGLRSASAMLMVDEDGEQSDSPSQAARRETGTISSACGLRRHNRPPLSLDHGPSGCEKSKVKK